MSVEPGVYTHYKSETKQYEVLGVGFEEATMNKIVIYKALYAIPELGGDNVLFTRPVEEFCGNVEVNGTIIPRFKKIT